MTLGTHLAIAVILTMASFGIWVAGIWLQWSLGLRDKPQVLTMLLVMALPICVGPAIARMAVSLIRPDAALLPNTAMVWYGMGLLALWGCTGLLLNFGVGERAAAVVGLGGVVLVAFVSSYAG